MKITKLDFYRQVFTQVQREKQKWSYSTSMFTTVLLIRFVPTVVVMVAAPSVWNAFVVLASELTL